MQRLDAKHPRAIRWMHWINFPVLTVMIWSGLLIYWANDVYDVRLGGVGRSSISFPTGFIGVLGLARHLAKGMAYHFAFMWFFAVNGVLYVLYTFWSGEWRASAAQPRHAARGVARGSARPWAAEGAAAQASSTALSGSPIPASS